MQQKSLNIYYEEYKTAEELNEADRILVEKAKEATKSAYAPYSKFNVGAAVLLDNGQIVTGSNQENAAYPSGLCAERVAIFYAQSLYPKAKVVSIAITASVNGEQCDTPTYPCGACRQVLSETETRGGSPVKVIIAGKSLLQKVSDISSLLPFTFDNLPK